MNPALRNLLITVGVILVIGAGVFLYAKRAGAPTASPEQTATTTSAGITYTGSSTATVTDTSGPPAQNIGPAPDYNKTLSYPSGTSADVETALNAQMVVERSTLAKDPTNFDAWVNLGNIYSIASDYSDAIAVYTYITKLYPTSNVPYDDLASIYMDYDKNYPKAEANLKAAISLSPTDTSAYGNLVALYTTYGYGTTAQAQAVVAQGLKANPGNANLLQLQSQLNAQ